MKSYKLMTKQKPNLQIYFTLPYIVLIMLSLKTFYFRYVTFSFVMLFIIVFIIKSQKAIIKKKYLYLFWFLFGYFYLGILNGSVIQMIKNISMMMINLAPFFIFDWVFSECREKNRQQNSKILVKIMTPVLMYTVIATLYYLISNPYIARYMANYDPSKGIDPSMGISIDLPTAIGGGYVLIYGIILLPPFFLYLSKNIYNKLSIKALFMLISLLLICFVVKSGFATAFIICSLGSAIVLVFSKKQRIFNKIILAVIIIIASILLLNMEFLTEMINSIVSILPKNSIVSIRLTEIVPALYFKTGGSSSFSMRLIGLNKTVNAFLENPILGVGYKVGFDYLSISQFTGLHTEWLDILSQYGLFLGFPLLLFIGCSFKELVRLFKDTSMELIIKIVVAMVIILGFFNPILSSSVFIISMLYIPSFIIFYIKKEFKMEEIFNEGTNSNYRQLST